MEDPLLPSAGKDVVAGADVGHRGGWRSSFFIIGAYISERFAFYGLSANLITYLTGPLRQPTAAAVAALNVWSGVSSILPLACAVVADRWLGRRRTILPGYFLYIAGSGLLVVSAAMSARLPPPLQLASFYAALYVLSVAQACVPYSLAALGAEQFDVPGEAESGSSSFFTWCNAGMCIATTAAVIVMSYVQDNVGWVVGFGMPCLAVVVSLAVFLLGTTSYRYGGSVSVDRRAAAGGGITHFLRLTPIWAACLMSAVCIEQFPTTFTKGAAAMDRRIGATFRVPPASLQSIESATPVILLALYDRLLVPYARRLSGCPSGITTLQRIGGGLLLSTAAMAAAAAVEMRRLEIARPMSVWWLLPHYVLFGVSDTFVLVGVQEFFYSEAPGSLGIAVGLSISGIGSLASGALLSAIDVVSARMSGRSWFSDSDAHLDYFYWILAALSAASFFSFLFFSSRFRYNSKKPLS